MNTDNRRRKTVKVSDFRAWANMVLAGSDADLAGFREGVARAYEHISMDANDYHGYNDLVQVWDGAGAYIPDEIYRRHYFGEMTGEHAERAQEAISAYREAQAVSPEPAHRERLVKAGNVYATSGPAGECGCWNYTNLGHCIHTA